MNSVQVVVTGRTLPNYKGYVIPYDHRVRPHLQHYVGPNGAPLFNEFVTYEVPLYEVRFAGGGSYPAIRFGLRNRGDNTTPDSESCDAVGAAKMLTVSIEYSPYPVARRY